MQKKLLFLITKSNFGGAQRYVFDLATGLPRAEFDVVVAAGGEGELNTRLKAANVRVETIPSLTRDMSISKDWSALWEIARIIKQERPDILHINSSKAGIFGALLGRFCRVPKIIFTAHGWAFNEDRSWWQKVILKFGHWLTVLLAHDTVAVSHEVKRQMNWPGAQSKMTVIHNGRDIPGLLSRDQARDALTEIEPRLKIFPQDFWSLTIAELHPIKRHAAVINTLKELVEGGHTIRHLIIGGGEEMSALKTLIKDLGLQNYVFMLGPVPDAAQYLKAADVFILASRSEAMPYAILEAMMAEVPTIATAVGGIPEIIENGVSGILVPPLNNQALGKAITAVMNDASLRDRLQIGARNRQADFTLAKTLAHTINLYTS